MTFTRLRFHIITATRGRKPLLTKDVEGFAYKEMRCSAERKCGKILVLGGIEDHVHMLVATQPNVALSDFVKVIKQDSSREISKRFPHLNDFKWQVGFTGFTVNPHDMDDVYAYISNQKNRHSRGTTKGAWEPG